MYTPVESLGACPQANQVMERPHNLITVVSVADRPSNGTGG